MKNFCENNKQVNIYEGNYTFKMDSIFNHSL